MRLALSIVMMSTAVLPAQIVLAGASTETGSAKTAVKEIKKTEATKVFVTSADAEEKPPVLNTETDTKAAAGTTGVHRIRKETISSSTLLKIGGGVAITAGLIALAASGGGGSSHGSDNGSRTASSSEPPLPDRFVSAWKATGDQPGSGRTYIGEFHLYPGGALSYALSVSNGEQLSGSGNWGLSGYQLTVRTDHGSIYSGYVTPGDYNLVHLNSNTGWNLYLAR